MNYDVIIVGAGPAGSIAARKIAEHKFKVLVVEKRQEIGTPKRCAEGLDIRGMAKVGIRPDPRWATNKINGSILYTPSGRSLEINVKNQEGYILERKIFEKFLAADAIRAGAKYMVKTRATKAILEDGKVVGIEAKFMGETLTLKSKLVIAADGVDSKIGRSAGLKTMNVLKDFHSGVQYEMAGLKLDRSDMLHIYTGNKVAPRGYIWIFPKGKDVANVGIGIVGTESKKGEKAREYLDSFISSHPEIFKNASPIEINAGGIPTGLSTEPLTADGIMVVGDAAHQVNPIHGGGIAIAMNAARIASEVAVKALKESDVSKERLHEYEERWWNEEGNRLKTLLKLKNIFERFEDKDFERVADLVTPEELLKILDGDKKTLMSVVVKRMPTMLPLARKLLK